jgi:hypothetical protein
LKAPCAICDQPQAAQQEDWEKLKHTFE